MKYTVFAIDNPTPTRRAAFFVWATNRLKGRDMGNIIKTMGRYNGVTEYSFIMTSEAYNAIVVPEGWTKEQESVLTISACNKKYAVLVYGDGRREGLGCMHHVTQEEAYASDGFTYRPDLDAYWVAKPGNPDDSFKESLRRTVAGEFRKGLKTLAA